MERYVTRPGVVLTSICDEYMLLAAKAAREHCPYMTQLNESSAFLWSRLEQGADPDALGQAVSEEYELADPADAREAIHGFLDQMLQLGYLLREGEEHEE